MVFESAPKMMLYAFALPFTLSTLMLLVLLKTTLSTWVLDKPNSRSLHSHTISRTGGLAIMLSVLATWWVMHIDTLWLLLLIPLIAISFVDDARGLSVRWRFLVQIIVAGCFVYFVSIHLTWWAAALLVFALVWMMNLYNFMDGSDGLAGGMAVFGFGTYAIAAYGEHNMQIAQISAALVASSLAFLIFNFHPAKIFMGDAGSVPLGFLAGAIGIRGWQQGIWPLWFPLWVFSPFILDATVTLFKRGLRGDKVWQAHREHYYQRLVQMGWGHKKTALAAYVLMMLISLTAYVLLSITSYWAVAICLLWLTLYAVFMTGIDAKWKRYQSNT